MWQNVFLTYALEHTLNLKDAVLPYEEFKMQPGEIRKSGNNDMGIDSCTKCNESRKYNIETQQLQRQGGQLEILTKYCLRFLSKRQEDSEKKTGSRILHMQNTTVLNHKT